ncbi:hypothetical protein EC9_07100 [Rosistilla ulvae]|uniref:Uncharacterized protein n=1 Tax=Rosistilla ulvae TaxID=1930277 RepID=A0A517LV92_9BACT|nr:DUF4175 family protein [Rosistilla ulvae]QDS86544.1 hypothetical protein EC9_07100 [Rosistilla ulvae]
MSTTPSHHPSTAHPLLRRVRGLSWQAHGLLLIRAIAIVAASLILLAIGLGTIDWLVRSRSLGWRWLSTGLLVAAAVGLAWRWLIPAIRLRLRGTDVARQIEAVFPTLGDRLSSSIDFLESPRPSKSHLEAAVIDRTTQDVQGLSFATALNLRPTLAALAAAAAIAAVLSGLWFQDSATVSHAAARLAQPWRQLDWPRRHHLQIDPLPQVVHRGDSLEVVVRDPQADLPSDAVVLVRTPAGTQRLALQQAGHSGVARIENVQSRLEIRATGGDDDTLDWQTVDVIQSPEITRNQWTLTPPGYAGKPQQTIEALRFDVVGGTRAVLELSLSKPITEATLRQSASNSPDSSVAGEGNLAADGLTVNFELLELTEDCQFQVEWTDGDGLPGSFAQQWTIRVVADSPPQVAWSESTRVSMVTPGGELALNWTAEDDFGMTETGGRWNRPGRSAAEDAAEASDFATRSIAEIARTADGTALFKPSDWKLQAGETIELTAWATDQQGQRGVSPTLSLAIVSEAVIRQQVAENENTIVEKMRDATVEQRAARDQVLAAAAELKPDQDRAAAAERVDFAATTQQQSRRTLQESGGAIDLARQAVELLENNGLVDADSQRLGDLLAALTELADENSSEIVDAIANAADAMEDEVRDAAATSKLKQQLDRIGQQQQEVVDRLESLAGELVKRDAVRDLSRQLDDLLSDQQRLQNETADLDAADDSAKDSRQQTLGNSQQELSRRAARLAAEIAETASDLPDEQAPFADRLQRAADRLNEDQVVGQMRSSAEDLKSGRLGQSMEKQSQIEQALQSTRAALEGSDRSREESLSDAIQAAAEGLENAADQQQQIGRRVEDPQEEPSELADDWKQLADQTQRLREQVERLGAEQAADRIDQAVEAQSQGQQQLQAGDRESAQRSSQTAQQQLDEARDQLAQMQKQVDADQQRKKMWAFIEQLEEILANQRTLIARIEAAESGALGELAATEKQLAQRVQAISPMVAELAGFDFVMSGAADDMNRVAAMLARDDKSPAVIDAAGAALARLEQVLEAVIQQMRQPPGNEPTDSSQQDPQQQQDGPDDNENGQPSMASLRLLLGLQQWLLDRTAAVEAIEPGDEAQRDYKQQAIRQLAQRQQKLRDQFQSLLKQAPAPAADNEGDGI